MKSRGAAALGHGLASFRLNPAASPVSATLIATARRFPLTPLAYRLIFVHALPNAAAPIITVVALNLAYLIVGVVVIESVFVYPGIGQYMVDGVSKRDLPVVQACGLVFAIPELHEAALAAD